jgi:hypothetical protein
MAAQLVASRAVLSYTELVSYIPIGHDSKFQKEFASPEQGERNDVRK